MQKNKFIKGALWLSLTSAALRLVGMGYRIFISDRLGEAGMGLYQLILSVYMLCAAFGTAGVSMAVTRLVSQELVQGGRDSVRGVVRFCLGWSMSVATLVAIVMFAGAPWIADTFLHSPQSAAGLRILSTGLPCMAAAAVFGGYFLGRSRVWYSCAAQVGEQLVRCAVTALLIDRLLTSGTDIAVGGVFFANAAGEWVAAALLYLFYLNDNRRLPAGGKKSSVYARFLPIQLPIAAGRYITSLLHTAENMLVPSRLERFGGNRQDALADFGALKGMALPLIMFPSSLLQSLAGMLIPEFTAAATLGKERQIKELTRRTLLITFLFSLWMGGMFFRFGGNLGELLFHSSQVGRILTALAPVIPFMYLDCITDGLLKGMGQQLASLRYCTTDSLLRIALVFILLHRYGLDGFLWVMAVSNISVALLGLRRLIMVTKARLPLVQGILLPLAALAAAHLLSAPIVSLWASGAVYALIYLSVVLIGCKELHPLLKPRR